MTDIELHGFEAQYFERRAAEANNDQDRKHAKESADYYRALQAEAIEREESRESANTFRGIVNCCIMGLLMWGCCIWPGIELYHGASATKVIGDFLVQIVALIGVVVVVDWMHEKVKK